MSRIDGETVAGAGVVGCGCLIMGSAILILVGLVVLVWRFALGL